MMPLMELYLCVGGVSVLMRKTSQRSENMLIVFSENINLTPEFLLKPLVLSFIGFLCPRETLALVLISVKQSAGTQHKPESTINRHLEKNMTPHLSAHFHTWTYLQDFNELTEHVSSFTRLSRNIFAGTL